MNRTSSRDGFTLITILWVLTVASVVATAAALAGRNAVNANRNRTQLERAFWIATGCASRTRAAIDDRLHEAPTFEDAARLWRILNRVVLPVGQPAEDNCRVVLEAAGTRLDVNSATGPMTVSLLRALGYGDDAAQLADAFTDWIDEDDVAGPAGAERAWYEHAQRELPRNAPLADIRELARVRGFENLSLFDSVLTAEPGRVSLATAPVTVLMAVPGITRETAERIAALHEAGTPVGDPLSVMGSVSPPSAEAIMSHYSDIIRFTTTDPDAWILTVTGISGLPSSEATLEWRLVRSGKHCVVVRTRSAI